MHSGPLKGVKVVEIAGIGPGPCAGMMLADMGAEVILVERKAADSIKSTSEKSRAGLIINRGKKSIALNLKDPESLNIVLKLVESADILIEGFRPGVMERLGMGPDVCFERNKKLIYGRMTGWGQSGPLSKAAGHDSNYIALSGALWYGAQEDKPPTAPLTLVGDLGGGTMVLLFGILSALIHAGNSGVGQVVDAAISDGSAYISTLLWMMNKSGLVKDESSKSWIDGAAPWCNTYQCLDGKFVTVCSLEPQFYQELLERLDLACNPVFSEQWNEAKWSEGKAIMKSLFAKNKRSYWCEQLEGTDVCFAPVMDLNEAAQHPHNVERNTFVEIDGVKQPAPAPKLSATEPFPGRVPELGEHTENILSSIDLDDNEIRRLKKLEII